MEQHHKIIWHHIWCAHYSSIPRVLLYSCDQAHEIAECLNFASPTKIPSCTASAVCEFSFDIFRPNVHGQTDRHMELWDDDWWSTEWNLNVCRMLMKAVTSRAWSHLTALGYDICNSGTPQRELSWYRAQFQTWLPWFELQRRRSWSRSVVEEN